MKTLIVIFMSLICFVSAGFCEPEVQIFTEKEATEWLSGVEGFEVDIKLYFGDMDPYKLAYLIGKLKDLNKEIPFHFKIMVDDYVQFTDEKKAVKKILLIPKKENQ